MCSSEVLLREGLRWKVGDGIKIKVWEDSWLRSESFNTIGPCTDPSLTNPCVRDLYIPGTSLWNSQMINVIFEPHIAAEIVKVPLLNTETDDKLIWSWRHTKDGLYRSFVDGFGYHHLRVEGEWRLVWDIQVPPHVKVFIWRAGNLVAHSHYLRSKQVVLEGSQVVEVQVQSHSHKLDLL